MYQSPLHTREALPGGDSEGSAADLCKGRGAPVSLLPPGVPVRSVAGGGHTAAVLGCLGTRLFLRSLCFVAVIWAFIPSQASTAGSVVAHSEATRGDCAVHGAVANRPAPSRAVARSNCLSTLRSGKHHAAFHKTAHPDSANGDDTTSNDPDDDDDDDTSNDLRDDGDNDEAITAFVDETVLCMIGLDDESAPTWTQNLSSPFPAGQRLRC
jgi:hypothetical protein